MSEENRTAEEIEREERRRFLKQAGKVAAAAPVAAMLLSAKAKPSRAWGGYGHDGYDGGGYDWYDWYKKWF